MSSDWLRFPQQVVTNTELEASQVSLITKTRFLAHRGRIGSEKGAQKN